MVFHGTYGHLKEVNKKKTWELMHQLSNNVGNKGVVMGDLNNTESPKDKIGGNPRSSSPMQVGRNMMEVCRVNDMDFEGYSYTWMEWG